MPRHHRVLIIAGLSVLLAGCAAHTPESPLPQSSQSARPASASVATTAPSSPEAADLGDLRKSLEHARLSVGAYRQDTTKLDKEAKPLFPGAPLHPYYLQVQGTVVSANTYPTSGEAARVVSRINRKDPFPLIDFKGTPHVFLHDRAIVMFVATSHKNGTAWVDGRILTVLRSQFGTDYASAQ